MMDLELSYCSAFWDYLLCVLVIQVYRLFCLSEQPLCQKHKKCYWSQNNNEKFVKSCSSLIAFLAFLGDCDCLGEVLSTTQNRPDKSR